MNVYRELWYKLMGRALLTCKCSALEYTLLQIVHFRADRRSLDRVPCLAMASLSVDSTAHANGSDQSLAAGAATIEPKDRAGGDAKRSHGCYERRKWGFVERIYGWWGRKHESLLIQETN